MKIFITKLIFLISAALAGCDSFEDLTPESETVKNYIERSICTDVDLFLWRWKSNATDHFEYEEYALQPPSKFNKKNETLEEHMNDSFIVDYGEELIQNITLIPSGTKFHIKEIYYYNKILCCSGYLMMANKNGKKINNKMVNISMIFEIVPDRWQSIITLNTKYAHLCQKNITNKNKS